jgi:hypothetical protein
VGRLAATVANDISNKLQKSDPPSSFVLLYLSIAIQFETEIASVPIRIHHENYACATLPHLFKPFIDR